MRYYPQQNKSPTWAHQGEEKMCEFVSWIEYDGEEYFLTNADLETKAGRQLLKSDVRDDLCGHGAIMAYYPELKDK